MVQQAEEVSLEGAGVAPSWQWVPPRARQAAAEGAELEDVVPIIQGCELLLPLLPLLPLLLHVAICPTIVVGSPLCACTDHSVHLG